MEAQASGIEPVTLNDILGLATWERQRSTDELQSFIESRHASIGDIDLDL